MNGKGEDDVFFVGGGVPGTLDGLSIWQTCP